MYGRHASRSTINLVFLLRYTLQPTCFCEIIPSLQTHVLQFACKFQINLEFLFILCLFIVTFGLLKEVNIASIQCVRSFLAEKYLFLYDFRNLYRVVHICLGSFYSVLISIATVDISVTSKNISKCSRP